MSNYIFNVMFYYFGIVYLFIIARTLFKKPNSDITKMSDFKFDFTLDASAAMNTLGDMSTKLNELGDLNKKSTSTLSLIGKYVRRIALLWIIIGLYMPEKLLFIAIIAAIAINVISFFLRLFKNFNVKSFYKEDNIFEFTKMCLVALIIFNHFYRS